MLVNYTLKIKPPKANKNKTLNISNMKKEIETLLIDNFDRMNMDIPSNFDDILEFVYRDIKETAQEKTKKLMEIAQAAYAKRAELISLYRKQGRGNVVIKLPHGCAYVYGETIKTPEICFNAGNTITDMELWNKTIWSK